MVGMDFLLALSLILIVGRFTVIARLIGGLPFFFSLSSSRAVEGSFMIGIVGVSLVPRE